jgi:two-component system, chemotaxis family, chemotaxis protein CheY
MNVLVVDDSAVMRAVIARTLEMSGLPLRSVHQAANGSQALELLRDEQVDLLLLDISMPVMRGDELLERVRAEARLTDLPVIVLSSERSGERIARLEALGAEFLRKPFTPEQLRSVVLNISRVPDAFSA